MRTTEELLIMAAQPGTGWKRLTLADPAASDKTLADLLTAPEATCPFERSIQFEWAAKPEPCLAGWPAGNAYKLDFCANWLASGRVRAAPHNPRLWTQ